MPKPALAACRPALPRGLRGLRAAVLLTIAAWVAAPAWSQPRESTLAELVQRLVPTADMPAESEMLQRATVAMRAITRLDLPQASKALNEALQLDPRNTHLHFFNGLVYHLLARQGDAGKTELAIEGYQQALRIDGGNWIAREFLGLALLDQRQYEPARTQFAEVLLTRPDSTTAQYGLMSAAYLSGDARTACAMADALARAWSEPSPAYLRSSVAVYAACGNFERAEAMRAQLFRRDPAAPELAQVDQRLARWKAFLGTPSLRPVQYKPDAAPAEAAPAPAPAPAPVPVQVPLAAPAPRAAAAPADDGLPRMVLIDVVMITTGERVATSKGINLLTALQLQLGSATAPAYSRSVSNTDGDSKTLITRALTVPGLAYSLNIANANDGFNEVLARPTLAAVDGMPSEFFSGTTVTAGVVTTSQNGNSGVVALEKKYGVRLAVTPGFMPGGAVKMKVEASRTFLEAPEARNGFSYRLDISENSVNANVVMQLGDTLVLSGLSERENTRTRDGVPGLQEVPLLQYLFAHQTTSAFQRAVLILLTPRSATYTARAEAAPNPDAAARLQALRERFGFVTQVPPNVEAILEQMKASELAREFRQGDISMLRWDRLSTTGDRLRKALEFLYY